MKKFLPILLFLSLVTFDKSLAQYNLRRFGVASNCKIYVTSTQNNSWSNYEGTGYTPVRRMGRPNDTVSFAFEGIEVYQSGAEVFMGKGVLKSEYKDTFRVNNQYPLFIDSISFDKNGVKAYYRYYYHDTLSNVPFNYSFSGWDVYNNDSGYPSVINTNNEKNTIRVNNFLYTINSAELVYVGLWTPPSVSFSGSSAFIYLKDTVNITFSGLQKFDYLANYSTSSIIHSKPFNINIKNVTFDCSRDTSPKSLAKPKLWEGIYLNSISLGINSKDSTYKVTQDINYGDNSDISYCKYDNTTSYIDSVLNLNINNTISDTYFLKLNNLKMKVNQVRLQLPFNPADSNYIKLNPAERIYSTVNDKYLYFKLQNNGFEIPISKSPDTLFRIYPYYLNGRIFEFKIRNNNYYCKGIIDTAKKTIDLAVPAQYINQSFQVCVNFSGSVLTSGYVDNYNDVINDQRSINFKDYNDNLVSYTIYVNRLNTSINDPYTFKDVFICPTLVSDYLTINNLVFSKDLTIDIIAITGKTHMSIKNTENTISVSGLSPGIYILRITSGNKIISKKIIKL